MSALDPNECPSNNMRCVLQVLAEVLAAVTQLTGTASLVLENPEVPAAEKVMLRHQVAVAGFLQATLDTYQERHDEPPLEYVMRADRKLRDHLKR